MNILVCIPTCTVLYFVVYCARWINSLLILISMPSSISAMFWLLGRRFAKLWIKSVTCDVLLKSGWSLQECIMILYLHLISLADFNWIWFLTNHITLVGYLFFSFHFFFTFLLWLLTFVYESVGIGVYYILSLYIIVLTDWQREKIVNDK